MEFQFLKEKSDKTGIGEYVGLEVRLKKGIRPSSELFPWRENFVKRKKIHNEVYLYF